MNKATKWTELGTLVESSRRGDVYMGTLMQNTVYGHIEKSMELCFCEPDVCIVIGWMTHFAQQHHWPTFISSREACLFRERKGSFEWKIPYSSASCLQIFSSILFHVFVCSVRSKGTCMAALLQEFPNRPCERWGSGAAEREARAGMVTHDNHKEKMQHQK